VVTTYGPPLVTALPAMPSLKTGWASGFPRCGVNFPFGSPFAAFASTLPSKGA